MRIYFDKRGVRIAAGMTIRHDDGQTELVYECGDDDLGVNASSEAWLRAHPNASPELYPLHQFNTRKEWEITQ